MAGSGLNVAATYLASRRATQPFDASLVMTDGARETLAALPALNAQLATQLARDTLSQVGENARSKMQWDAWAEAQKLPYQQMTKADKAMYQLRRSAQRRELMGSVLAGGGLDGAGVQREQMAGNLLARAMSMQNPDPIGQTNYSMGTTMATMTGLGVTPSAGDQALQATLQGAGRIITTAPAGGGSAPVLPERPQSTPVATRSTPPLSMPQAQGVPVQGLTSAEQSLLEFWKRNDARQPAPPRQ
ncbi:MAG: hypothetical protein VKI63_06175 [Cyanobium sp.]|nr:hypothetical protein [Cyanobium sp.]